MNNKKFFSDDVSEPVQVMVVNGDALQEPRIECCFNLEQLDAVLKHQVSQEKTFTFISICQKNSWRPLQITESMFNAIVSHYELNDCAHELVSCFYGRKEDIEETYCETLSHLRSDASSDISYTFRYPEFKAQNNRWSLRQSGVYHRVQHDTGHHVIILLSPSPKSAASQRISDKLSDVSLSKLGKDGLWVHSLLFSTYIPSWRQYIYHLQEQLLPATNSALAADIDRKMHVTYEDLNALYRLINTLVKLPAMIVQSSDVLQGLLKQNPQGDSSQTSVQQIANLERRTVGYSRMASCLHQQAQASAQLLSDTLSLRDQTIDRIWNELFRLQFR
ncbi:hypothetical protein F5Y16DRAFT_305053 [Xylariaceae sp. FL0255]|nr:hypothetical protein F5Y16DRAFT_305053 [Xylariaceae sp. FL0255]